MPNNTIRVGNVEILSLSDGLLEFDLCNFFPTIPQEQWQPYESHLTAEHHVRFNLGSFLVRSDGRTILVDTGLEEEQRMSARLTVTIEKNGNICAMQKGGLSGFTLDELKTAVHLAVQKSAENRAKVLAAAKT